MLRDRSQIQTRRPGAHSGLACAATLLIVLAPLLAPATSAARRAADKHAVQDHAHTRLHARAPRTRHAAPTAHRAPARTRVAAATAPTPARGVKPAEAKGATKEAPAATSPPPQAGAGLPAQAGEESEEHEQGEADEADAAAGHGAGNLQPESGETLNDPIDPRFLTDVSFGRRSFWLQPWRAYIDTWPASRLLDSVGINFPANDEYAEATAQLLQESGFKLARMQISWNALSYSEPTALLPSHLASIGARLTAMQRHGLRPLIVLDANSEDPTPFKLVKLETTAAAAAGAQSVKLTPASAAQVVPGRTGFNGLSFPGSADILITSLGAGDVAHLSRPLLAPLAAGSHGGTTLRYAPFQPPKLADGETNPAFAATLAGWLAYVHAVCEEAASVVGPGGYDIEVWNELSFGSQFLNSEHYYAAGSGSETEAGSEGEEVGQEAGEGETEAEVESEAEGTGTAPQHGKPHKMIVNKEIQKALLDETVAYVRNPANGFSPEVGITNGFASETPFPSGADAPLGLTALSKHPYTGPKDFPAAFHERAELSVNALGGRDTSAAKSYKPLFIPEYQSLFPEYWLTATSTETLIRDIAPFTTYVYHFPHGREVGPVGGVPVQKWITEFNQIPGRGVVMGPDEVTPQSGPSATLTPADKQHFQAKVALRSIVANVNKGIAREYFFRAGPGEFGLVAQGFFSALEANPGVYPGNQLGGETMTAMRRMLAHFQGPGPGGPARQLSLLSIRQEGNHAQFAGDGTAAHPSLYDRDVLAVLPFQSSPTRFVIPVYVMTRDLLTLYEPLAPETDVHRFDLPAERFWITLGNLPESAAPPSVGAYDPLLDESTPARLVSREGETAVFEIAATDYPRLLSIEYPSA
jgi:hypothetical protein